MFSTFSHRLSIQLKRFSIFWQKMFKVVCCGIVVWSKGLTLTHMEQICSRVKIWQNLCKWKSNYWISRKWVLNNDLKSPLRQMCPNASSSGKGFTVSLIRQFCSRRLWTYFAKKCILLNVLYSAYPFPSYRRFLTPLHQTAFWKT